MKHSPTKALKELRAKHVEPYDARGKNIDNLNSLDQLALWITNKVGTMGFFLAIFSWTAIWLSWNFLAPSIWVFDPPMSFVFYLFISNVIQICLMPLIMVGQNIEAKHAAKASEHSLELTIKSEAETELLLEHVEHQHKMLHAIIEKLGIDFKE